MSAKRIIPAALALDGLQGDARMGFEVAAGAGYRGVAFATNHAELNPESLGPSARRHVKAMLGSKGLAIEAVRAAVPRGGLGDAGTIDRTLENARKAMNLARELGVGTVALNIGAIGEGGERGVAEGTVISALRELAQQADAAGLVLAVGAQQVGLLGGILKVVDYDKARVNLDTGRSIGSAEDPLKLAELFAGRIGQVTAADAVRAGKTVRAAMLGEGQLPLHELLEILEGGGFGGPLVVDVRDLPDGVEGAAHAAEVLRTLLGR